MTHQPYFSGFDPLPSDIESSLMVEAKPLYLNSEGSADTVVICLHGFTGVPYEVAPAVKAIAATGLTAVAPLLPGHGYRHRPDQEREFARITKAGMLAAARQEIARAREHYSHVGMLGFSMGGAIALSMAAEGLLDACAVVAPALRLPLRGELLIPLLTWLPFVLPAKPSEPFHLPVYEFHHSWALRTLWQLRRHARRQLPQIRCPLLGVHSQNDLTVPPVVLDLMQSKVPKPVETVWFNDSGHVMLLDKSGAEVASTVTEFFQHHL